jgi:hypothetical protein
MCEGNTSDAFVDFLSKKEKKRERSQLDVIAAISCLNLRVDAPKAGPYSFSFIPASVAMTRVRRVRKS